MFEQKKQAEEAKQRLPRSQSPETPPQATAEDEFWNTPGTTIRTLHFADNLMSEQVALGDITMSSFASPVQQSTTETVTSLAKFPMPLQPRLADVQKRLEENNHEAANADVAGGTTIPNPLHAVLGTSDSIPSPESSLDKDVPPIASGQWGGKAPKIPINHEVERCVVGVVHFHQLIPQNLIYRLPRQRYGLP